LQELKKNKVASQFNDRFLAAFLLSRKLDVDRTLKMLNANLKWRKSNGYETIPSFDSLNKDVITSGFGLKIPGARDRFGCGLLFCKLGNMAPDKFENFDTEVLKWVIWNNSEGNLWEDMDFHRNGLTFVFDLKDIGWKNVDLRLQKRINSALMDTFPMKVKHVLVVNAPGIFKSLLAAARLFVKKKVTDRIQLLDSMSDLKKYIDEDTLPVEFGGKCKYRMEDYLSFTKKMIESNPQHTPKLQVKNQKLKLSHCDSSKNDGRRKMLTSSDSARHRQL